MVKAVVDRLLQVRSKLEPAQVEDLLWGIRCDEAIGQGYWLQDGHLVGLLNLLNSDSRVSRGLWRGLIARITRESFSTSGVAGEMETMAAARKDFPTSMEPGDRDRLDGWNAIRLHFASPSKPAPDTSDRLRKACEATGQTPKELTQQWFTRWVVTAPGDLERKKRNETLGHVLLGFYESENAAWDAARRLASGASDDVQRRMCEADLRGAILSEETRTPLGAKDAGLSVATVSTPNLRGEPGRRNGRKTKGLEQWKPYVAPFVAGCVLTFVLMLLLTPVLMVAYGHVSTWWQPKAEAKTEDPLAKMNRELESQLAASAREVRAGARQLADRDKEIVTLRGQLSKRTTEIESLREIAAKKDAEINRLSEALRLAQARNNEVPQGPAQSRALGSRSAPGAGWRRIRGGEAPIE